MSGHSHWATIRRKKGATDAKRGKIFSKFARIIATAARRGGADPEMNLSLKYAIDRARAYNMPNDNIERAVKKGAGGDAAETYQELVYEGYIGGVAMLIEALTDNRNRTAAEVRHALELKGASLGGQGSVAWMFHSKGLIGVQVGSVEEDKLMEIALEAGAEDINVSDNIYEITCSAQDLEKVRKTLIDNGIKPEVAQVSKVPQNYIDVDVSTAHKINALLEKLEDMDDIQEIYTNANMPSEEAETKKG